MRHESSSLPCLIGRWRLKVASEGGFPGYTFMDTGGEAGAAVAIGPRQSGPGLVSRP